MFIGSYFLAAVGGGPLGGAPGLPPNEGGVLLGGPPAKEGGGPLGGPPTLTVFYLLIKTSFFQLVSLTLTSDWGVAVMTVPRAIAG